MFAAISERMAGNEMSTPNPTDAEHLVSERKVQMAELMKALLREVFG